MIIKPFNAVFFAVLAIFVGMLIVASILLKGKSRKTKRTVLAVAMLVTFVIYWVYKIMLSMDGDYSDIKVANNLPAFSWWGELPLQLCNINLMLIPLAAILDNKRLYAFCFFVAPVAALMASMFPCVGFYDSSIFLPRNLGFYITHMMIIVGGIAIASFGLYRPVFRDIPLTFAIMMAITACVVAFDFICYYGVGIKAVNYFYAMDHEEISVLKLFYDILPVPGLYLVLCGVFILLPYVALSTSVFELCHKISEKKKTAA